jgi:hypothetical protein
MSEVLQVLETFMKPILTNPLSLSLSQCHLPHQHEASVWAYKCDELRDTELMCNRDSSLVTGAEETAKIRPEYHLGHGTVPSENGCRMVD